MTNAIGLTQPGKSVKIGLFHDRTQKIVSVTLARFPDKKLARNDDTSGEESGAASALAKKGAFGLALGSVTPEEKHRLGLESHQGALVQGVTHESSAERAGLQPGDAIVLVSGKSVSGPADFVRLTNGKDKVLLRVERAGNFFFVSLKKADVRGQG